MFQFSSILTTRDALVNSGYVLLPEDVFISLSKYTVANSQSRLYLYVYTPPLLETSSALTMVSSFSTMPLSSVPV